MRRDEIRIESPAGDAEHDDHLRRETVAYLAREEALHCIQLSAALAEPPHGKTTFLTAKRGDTVVGVGSITGTFNLLL